MAFIAQYFFSNVNYHKVQRDRYNFNSFMPKNE